MNGIKTAFTALAIMAAIIGLSFTLGTWAGSQPSQAVVAPVMDMSTQAAEPSTAKTESCEQEHPVGSMGANAIACGCKSTCRSDADCGPGGVCGYVNSCCRACSLAY